MQPPKYIINACTLIYYFQLFSTCIIMHYFTLKVDEKDWLMIMWVYFFNFETDNWKMYCFIFHHYSFSVWSNKRYTQTHFCLIFCLPRSWENKDRPIHVDWKINFFWEEDWKINWTFPFIYAKILWFSSHSLNIILSK